MSQIFKKITAVSTILILLTCAVIIIPTGKLVPTTFAQVTPTASLSFSPSTNSVPVNSTFNVNIVLNTGGQATYGVDINRLRFNPSILQVVDADATRAGVQVAAGSLMSINAANVVDNVGGSIQFSQLADYSSTFTGSGTLFTVTFRAISVGTSNTTLDFTSGSGVDSNVAGLGGDLLSSVGTGSYVGIAPDIAPTAPGTPILTVISSSQINLSWTASTDAGGVAGYMVERCSGSATCSTYAQVGTPTTNSFSDLGLTPSTVYRYRVRATDITSNLSAYSNPAYATTLAPLDVTPPTIFGVVLSGITATGATITWSTDENSDTQVFYGHNNSTEFQTTLNSDHVIIHTVTLGGLSAGTSYHYVVKSRDTSPAGNLATSVDNIFTTRNLPDTTPPTAPTQLTANPTSESQVQISWAASADPAGIGQNVSGVANYQVFRGGVLLGSTASTAYLDTGLTPGGTYNYQVTAIDASGNVSPSSLPARATTPLLSLSVQRRITIPLEGAPSSQRNVPGTLEFLDPSTSSKVYQSSFTTDNGGQRVIDVPAGLLPLVTFRPVVAGYLSRLLTRVDLRSASVLDASFPTLPAGDFVSDQFINTLDFSYMNSRWNMVDSLADINKDGRVNSLDFAFMSKNWSSSGE